MTNEEKGDWRAVAAQFMRKRGNKVEENGVVQKKRARKQTDIPRSSAWDWLLMLQNFEVSFGYGLERWIPGPRPYDEPRQEGEPAPGLLVGCFDHEAVQWSGAFFLLYALQGQVLFFPGRCHRRGNDADRAFIQAGDFMTVAQHDVWQCRVRT